MKITVPTLLLDKDRCLKNLDRMQQKAIHNQIAFRPHMKTPQSNGVGEWLQEKGITKIAVSSLRMAAYYAKGGWKDITVAFPVNILELDLVNELAADIRLNILVESVKSVQQVANHLQEEVGVFIKIDAGYGRTGLSTQKMRTVEQVVDSIANTPKMNFKGFLMHAGHTYKTRNNLEKVKQIHKTHIHAAETLRTHFQTDFPDLTISYGDTPSCSILDNFAAFDELRPGNFMFYDLSQYHIGSCKLEDIAVAMLCPVVALHPDRSEIVVYGGGVHLSKDRNTKEDGGTYFGQVIQWNGTDWAIPDDYSYVRSLSQEHGIIKASPELLQRTQIGDLLAILPIHSCMAVDLMPFYLTTKGERIEIWNKI